MKWILLGVASSVLFLICVEIRRRRQEYGHGPYQRVSQQWLAAQALEADHQGIDSVSWQWPVRKLSNEASHWNAQKRIQASRRLTSWPNQRW